MSFIKVVQSGVTSCQNIINKDREILETAKEPTFHFGRFSDRCLTFGHDMVLEDHIDTEALKSLGINAVKRHTPGGALFHMWDLVFSLVVPFEAFPKLNKVPKEFIPHYTFKMINECIFLALHEFLPDIQFISDQFLVKRFLTPQPYEIPFCMGKPTRLDIMHKNRKIVGGAEVFYKNNLLHNATVSICKPDEEILKRVLKNPKIAEKMLENSFYLSNFPYTDKVSLSEIQSKIEYQIFKTFEDYLWTKDNLVS